ncbi:hypothetical protein [Deinococcus sp.]|uniref:hypothetical protein n=1 Tax=Deinococcus sp. TaxID=47478 RepID=UPI0025BB62D0|nr:hypothetical protein [Deinococcus sp.]
MTPASPEAAPTAPTAPTVWPSGPFPLAATTGEARDIWQAAGGGAAPDPHRVFLKRLVEYALSEQRSGEDLYARVTGDLGDLLSPETRDSSAGRGQIETEIRFAQQQLWDEQRERAVAAAHERLRPHFGQRFGTLIWLDDKRRTGCFVWAVDGLRITLAGRRDRRPFKLHTDARDIEDALRRTRQREEDLARTREARRHPAS